MKTLIKKETATAALACLLLSMAVVSANAAEFMTPEFARGDYRPKAMVVIPPHAEVTKNKVASTEMMIDVGAGLEDAAASTLMSKYTKLGYDVRALRVDEVNADPALQEMVRNLNERYDEEMVRVVKKPKDVRKRRFKIGDEARILAARLDAEGLIVARIYASGATGGQKTMAVLFGGSMGHAQLAVGIIAGDNGDLEGYFTGIDPGMSPDKLQNEPLFVMDKVTAKALKDYPAVDEVAKVKGSPKNTDRQVPEALESDQEVMADLEAMFGDETDAGDEEAGDEEAGDEDADDGADTEEAAGESSLELE